ncbi:hypothetical protein T4D_13317, partial [Trichinella pseudospiralis]
LFFTNQDMWGRFFRIFLCFFGEGFFIEKCQSSWEGRFAVSILTPRGKGRYQTGKLIYLQRNRRCDDLTSLNYFTRNALLLIIQHAEQYKTSCSNLPIKANMEYIQY